MRQIRKMLALVACLLVTGAVGLMSPTAAGAQSPSDCSKRTVTVKLKDETSAPNYQVTGWLCGEWDDPSRTVQVLVSGATYDHHYFDFPYAGFYYSYVKAAVARDYVVFNIDRIGLGESSHPPDAEVGIPSNAFVVHQVVTALRNGTLTGHAVKKVMLVSHSLGSQIAAFEAGTYEDVDGLVLSGWLHNTNPDSEQYVEGLLVPAQDEPRLADRPTGYMTTAAGHRDNPLLYFPGGFDPAVIAVDEATKQTATTTEFIDFGVYASMDETLNIKVPILIAQGGQDLDCLGGNIPSCTKQNIAANEAPFYDPAACLQVKVTPAAGHNILLHFTGPLWRHSVLNWADEYVGKKALPERGCH